MRSQYQTICHSRACLAICGYSEGAKANEILYTLVENARANNLDVYEYLKYLLTELSNSRYLEYPEVLEQYLPWSETLPARCRLEYKREMCLAR